MHLWCSLTARSEVPQVRLILTADGLSVQVLRGGAVRGLALQPLAQGEPHREESGAGLVLQERERGVRPAGPPQQHPLQRE